MLDFFCQKSPLLIFYTLNKRRYVIRRMMGHIIYKMFRKKGKEDITTDHVKVTLHKTP